MTVREASRPAAGTRNGVPDDDTASTAYSKSVPVDGRLTRQTPRPAGANGTVAQCAGAHRSPRQLDRLRRRAAEHDRLEAERLAGLERRPVGRHDEPLGADVRPTEPRVGRQLAAEGLLDLAGGLLEDPRQDVLLPVGDGAVLAAGADRAVEVLHHARGERDHRAQRLERGLGLLPAVGRVRRGSHRGHRRPQPRGRAAQLAHRAHVAERLEPVVEALEAGGAAHERPQGLELVHEGVVRLRLGPRPIVRVEAARALDPRGRLRQPAVEPLEDRRDLRPGLGPHLGLGPGAPEVARRHERHAGKVGFVPGDGRPADVDAPLHGPALHLEGRQAGHVLVIDEADVQPAVGHGHVARHGVERRPGPRRLREVDAGGGRPSLQRDVEDALPRPRALHLREAQRDRVAALRHPQPVAGEAAALVAVDGRDPRRPRSRPPRARAGTRRSAPRRPAAPAATPAATPPAPAPGRSARGRACASGCR